MSSGQKIAIDHGKLIVPDNPVLPFIEGDGTGPDIWRASVRVFDAAVQKAYLGARKIDVQLERLGAVQNADVGEQVYEQERAHPAPAFEGHERPDEKHYRRSDPEGDEVGQRIEFKPEPARGLGEPCHPTVERVEDRGGEDGPGRVLKVAFNGGDDRVEAEEHPAHRQQVRQYVYPFSQGSTPIMVSPAFVLSPTLTLASASTGM